MTNAPKNFAEWRETLAKMARTVETGQRVLAVAERVQAALLATGVPARHCFPSVFDPNVASWRIGTYGIDDVQFMVDADEAGALLVRRADDELVFGRDAGAAAAAAAAAAAEAAASEAAAAEARSKFWQTSADKLCALLSECN